MWKLKQLTLDRDKKYHFLNGSIDSRQKIKYKIIKIIHNFRFIAQINQTVNYRRIEIQCLTYIRVVVYGKL